MKRASFLQAAMLSSFALMSCNSVSLGGNQEDAGGNGGGAGSLPGGASGGGSSAAGSSQIGGSGGTGGTGPIDAPALGGQGGGGTGGTGSCPARGFDADCAFGVASYFCVARAGGWEWDYTCPDPPRDAGPLQTDAQHPVDAASCPGPNPAARTCWNTVTECIPSSCQCADDGTWRCTTDCRAYPQCGVDGGSPRDANPVDAGGSTGCDPAKAAQAVSAAGLTTVGEAQTLNVDLPTSLTSSANWGVKEVECREGGYDLSAVAGNAVCLVSFGTTEMCQQQPANVWVVMSDGIVRCIYQSAPLNPGIYSVHDALCNSPDAGVSCPGANPAARTCRTTISDCIPSTCTCGSNGTWGCTADCRSYPLCSVDGGTSDASVACAGARIDTTQAAAAFAQHIRQINPGLNPATTFGADEKTVANLWDAMQAQLFFGKMYAQDGSVWQEVAFLYRGCAVTLPTEDWTFGLIDSGVVANGAFYYSWGWGSGIYRSNLGKLAPNGTSLVRTTSPAYFNPSSGPPGLVVALEDGRLVVYRATVYWGKFNEWLDPEPMGFLKDFGDRLAVVDDSGKELSTTLP
jgi:hypothetical protein